MKATFRAMALFLALVAFGPQAQAGLHLEPFLGYWTGKVDIGGTEEDLKGTDLGARVGYSMPLGLAVGAEYSQSNLELDDFTPTVKLEPTNLGAFVAYEFPILVRAYASYIFSSKGDYSVGSTSVDVEGSGVRIGVGFTGLPFVAINLEYVSLKHDECSPNCSVDIESKLYGINVSLPLDLL